MESIALPSTLTLALQTTKEGTLLRRSGPVGTVVKPWPATVTPLRLFTSEGPRLTLLGLSETERREGLAHLARLILGVTEGYRRRLRLVGVGYRAVPHPKGLSLSVGRSHEEIVTTSPGIGRTAGRGKGTLIRLTGVEKEVVSRVGAEIRSRRRADPYKGKGILWEGEIVKLRRGKRSTL